MGSIAPSFLSQSSSSSTRPFSEYGTECALKYFVWLSTRSTCNFTSNPFKVPRPSLCFSSTSRTGWSCNLWMAGQSRRNCESQSHSIKLGPEPSSTTVGKWASLDRKSGCGDASRLYQLLVWFSIQLCRADESLQELECHRADHCQKKHFRSVLIGDLFGSEEMIQALGILCLVFSSCIKFPYESQQSSHLAYGCSTPDPPRQ